MKTIHILVGPKGSGKTYVGNLISEHTNIPFVHVEKIFMSVRNNRDPLDKTYHQDGLRRVLDDIAARFKSEDALIIESTGAGEFFDLLLDALSNYSVKLHGIIADEGTIIQRLQDRSNTHQVPVSEEMISRMYELSLQRLQNISDVFLNENVSDQDILSYFIDRL